MINRRFFVRSVLPAAVVSLASKPIRNAIATEFNTKVVCAREFVDLVGESIPMKTGDGRSTKLILVDVTERRYDQKIPHDIRTDPFSCLWKIDSEEIEEGEVYLKHPRLGMMRLHLIPKWEEDGIRLYESIWN